MAGNLSPEAKNNNKLNEQTVLSNMHVVGRLCLCVLLPISTQFNILSMFDLKIKYFHLTYCITNKILVCVATPCFAGQVLVPDYLVDMFTLRSQIRNRQTRSSSALDIPLCRLSTGQCSFTYRGAKLWNFLNSNIKSLKCPRNFRRHFANVLLG